MGRTPSAYFRQIGRLSEESRAPAEAQRSGFGGKRRRSGMSEFSPFSAEMSDMELAPTKSRIKGWRRNRRSAQSLLPAVRAGDGGSAQSVVAPFEENFRAAGVLVPANADVPRNLVVPYGRFGRKSR